MVGGVIVEFVAIKKVRDSSTLRELVERACLQACLLQQPNVVGRLKSNFQVVGREQDELVLLVSQET